MKSLIVYFLIAIYLTACSQVNKSDNEVAITDGIPSSSMINEGVDSTVMNKLAVEIQKGSYPNIHSLLVARNNKLIYENYWPGKDQSWGNDLGMVNHNKDSLHDIRSISKSIVSACIGIALQQGKIKSVDQKVFDFFPEFKKYDTGIKSSLTIKHLLTMTSGLAWNEEIPYDNPENSEVRMIFSPNPIEYVLSRPMDNVPGKIWKYNGGTTQLLAAIIEKTTGMRIDTFAEKYLFTPLGINRYQWVQYPGTNLPAAASGLRLTSRDLLKFGLLYAQNGKWNNGTLIPATWVQESFQSHVSRNLAGTSSYGYQFWIWSDTVQNKPIRFVTAIGNGDQRIFMDTIHNLVIVVTAGNYNKWDIEKDSYALLKDFIYPAIIK